ARSPLHPDRARRGLLARAAGPAVGPDRRQPGAQDRRRRSPRAGPAGLPLRRDRRIRRLRGPWIHRPARAPARGERRGFCHVSCGGV
ncbi:MAG: hypothetical protein AVDCRST_MAG40-1192, partial [uncultured Gemmatimonadaceae bacterium]